MAKETKTTTVPLVLSIAAALVAIKRDITAIPKDQENKGQGFNFRGIDDLFNALHPVFATHGVVLLPENLETTFDKWKNAKGNECFAARVRTKYRFLAEDGSQIETIGTGEAYDHGDKALNKAQSMALKYVLLQMFQIPTWDMDADGYDYDQTGKPQTAPADPYAGWTLAQMEAKRDEVLAVGGMPEKELLGRISVLKAEAQDAATPAPTTTVAPKANGKAAAEAKKAEAAKKAAEAAAKPEVQKPAAPTPKPDVPPGAAEEPTDDFGEGETAPAGGGDALNAALEMVIEESVLKHKDYVGKKLGALSREHIASLVVNWIGKFKDAIDANEAKTALRAAVLLVHEMWEKQPK